MWKMKLRYIQVIITLFATCVIYSQNDSNTIIPINSVNKNTDSIKALNLRDGKHWFSCDEREFPLTLPKKVIMVQPVAKFDIMEIGYLQQYRIIPIDELTELSLPRVVLSPSDNIDITVFPYAFVEYALLNKVTNIDRVLYLKGPSLTIGGGLYRLVYDKYNWTGSDLIFTHAYLTRLKIPYNKLSWFSFSAFIKLENTYYSNTEIDISTSIKVNNSIYPIFGINLNNTLDHYDDEFSTHMIGFIGYDLLFNRHIRFKSVVGAGFHIERVYQFIGMLKFEFRGIW